MAAAMPGTVRDEVKKKSPTKQEKGRAIGKKFKISAAYRKYRIFSLKKQIQPVKGISAQPVKDDKEGARNRRFGRNVIVYKQNHVFGKFPKRGRKQSP